MLTKQNLLIYANLEYLFLGHNMLIGGSTWPLTSEGSLKSWMGYGKKVKIFRNTEAGQKGGAGFTAACAQAKSDSCCPKCPPLYCSATPGRFVHVCRWQEVCARFSTLHQPVMSLKLSGQRSHDFFCNCFSPRTHTFFFLNDFFSWQDIPSVNTMGVFSATS